MQHRIRAGLWLRMEPLCLSLWNRCPPRDRSLSAPNADAGRSKDHDGPAHTGEFSWADRAQQARAGLRTSAPTPQADRQGQGDLKSAAPLQRPRKIQGRFWSIFELRPLNRTDSLPGEASLPQSLNKRPARELPQLRGRAARVSRGP